MNKNKDLHKQIFKDNDQITNFFFDKVLDFKNRSETTIDGDLASVIYWRHFYLSFLDKQIKCDFLTSVATKPKYRNRGYVRNLINERIKHSDSGCILLHPFNHNFYEKLGFVTINYHCKNPSLYEKLYKTFTLKKIELSDAAILSSIYSQLTFKAERDSAFFDTTLRLMSKCGDLGYLIYNIGSPIGYIFFDGETISDFYIQEQFLTNDLKPYVFFDNSPNNAITENKYSMGRITDVFSFFYNYKFSELAQNFTIKIIDSINANNNKIFTFAFDNHELCDIKTIASDEVCDAIIPIEHLTAIAFGNKLRFANGEFEKILTNFRSFNFTLYNIF